MNLFRYSIPLLLAGLLQGMTAAAASDEMADFKAAIRAKYDLKEQAFADGEAEPIASGFYSADAISVDHEGVTHRGRVQLRSMYEQLTKTATVKVESVETRVKGDMGWDWANFHVTPNAPGVEPFSFKILFLWEKTDGEWWSAGDMFVPGEFDAGTWQTAGAGLQ